MTWEQITVIVGVVILGIVHRILSLYVDRDKTWNSRGRVDFDDKKNLDKDAE